MLKSVADREKARREPTINAEVIARREVMVGRVKQGEVFKRMTAVVEALIEDGVRPDFEESQFGKEVRIHLFMMYCNINFVFFFCEVCFIR